jgi:hypothetical protein
MSQGKSVEVLSPETASSLPRTPWELGEHGYCGTKRDIWGTLAIGPPVPMHVKQDSGCPVFRDKSHNIVWHQRVQSTAVHHVMMWPRGDAERCGVATCCQASRVLAIDTFKTLCPQCLLVAATGEKGGTVGKAKLSTSLGQMHTHHISKPLQKSIGYILVLLHKWGKHKITQHFQHHIADEQWGLVFEPKSVLFQSPGVPQTNNTRCCYFTWSTHVYFQWLKCVTSAVGNIQTPLCGLEREHVRMVRQHTCSSM